MQGDRQFHRAESGSEVAAHLADRVDEVLTQLRGDLSQLAGWKLAQVGW